MKFKLLEVLAMYSSHNITYREREESFTDDVGEPVTCDIGELVTGDVNELGYVDGFTVMYA